MARKKRHKFSSKPEKCPECGSTHILEIMYGFPAHIAVEQERAGKIILGGCIVDEGNPKWRCIECNTDFFFKEIIVNKWFHDRGVEPDKK